MWAQLQQLSTSGQVLKLEQPATFLVEDASEIWFRSCYEGLFNKIMDLYNQNRAEIGVLVTGNPGIGKSFFLIYLLLRFAKLKKTIILQLAEKKKAFLFKPGQDPIVVLRPLAELEELEDKSTIFLHNPKANKEPLFVNAFTVLASSPNPNNYKGFCKRMGCEKFYMPVWSEDEILSCNMSLQKWNVDEEVMIKRLSVCGGIPRFLLKYDSYYEDLFQAISKTDAKAVISAAAEPDMFKDFSHKLLHYEVSAAFTAVGMNFASDFIFDELVNQWEQQGASDLEYFVMETSSSATMAGARGKAFEKVAHRYLEKVSTLSVDLFMKFQDYQAFLLEI
jgi:hypothetical protein